MPLALSFLPCAIALTVLLGWEVDNYELKRFCLASATMNPMSACCVLMLSLAFMGGNRETPLRYIISILLLVLVLLVGLAKLGDVLLDSHFRIDAVLFSREVARDFPRPSRMAPNAAVCFALTGLGALLASRGSDRSQSMAQFCALATSLISGFALIGYLYGVGAFYVVAALHPMAIHTACSLICFSASIFVKTAHRGLLIPITSSGPAGRTSRALLPAAILVPIGFGWLRLKGEQFRFYETEIGIALMVVCSMLTQTLLIWWNARLLYDSDALRKVAEANLARLASEDFLTGLANRASFMKYANARIAQPRRRAREAVALIYMDLDGFKSVNDTFGHASGDKFLQTVAKHLSTCAFRDGDLVARVGGDEFAMLLDQIASMEEAEIVAQRILACIPRCVIESNVSVPVGMSLGIAIASSMHNTAEVLLSEADQALYEAKRSGKGRFVWSVNRQIAAKNARSM